MNSLSGTSILDLLPSFRRSLQAKNRAKATVTNYIGAARTFAEWLEAAGHSGLVGDVRQRDVEEFIGDQVATRSSSTAATRYRFLQQFFKWCVLEDELEVDPMARMEAPTIQEKVVDVLSEDELRRLLKACEGEEFEDRRDMALIRLLIDSGTRAGETMAIELSDLDLERNSVLVLGKGAKERTAHFGNKTAEALDRYMRARRRHKHASSPMLWLALRGPMTVSGLAALLRRRGAQAGIENLHPHKFRHTFSHRWLANGGTEGDLQALAGWSSPQMVQRYGASARHERAKQAFDRMALGDQL